VICNQFRGLVDEVRKWESEKIIGFLGYWVVRFLMASDIADKSALKKYVKKINE